jgi:hypothetical protein
MDEAVLPVPRLRRDLLEELTVEVKVVGTRESDDTTLD